MLINKTCLMVCVLIIVVSGRSVAQNTSTNHLPENDTVLSTVGLEELTITGKSENRRKHEQAYAISVVDLKQVYAAAQPLGKILSNVSSVRIREDGGVGSAYSFSLNGFSGNQVKFFLDGISMDNFGSSFNLSNISVNMAERIEIYKGVLPVSLGADALGGAVNIVSRKDAQYLDVSYSVGSFNTHRLAVNGAYSDHKTGFTVRANAFFNYSDNNYKVFVPIKDLNTGRTIREDWAERFHDRYQSAGAKVELGVTGKAFADYLLVGIIASQNEKDVQTGAVMDKVYGAVGQSSQSFIPSLRWKKSNLFVNNLSATFYGAYSAVNSFVVDTAARSYNWLGQWVTYPSKGERNYTDACIKNREYQGNANLHYAFNEHQSLTLNHVFSLTNRKIHDKTDPENESNRIPQQLNKQVTGLGWQIQYERWNANLFGKRYATASESYKKVDIFLATERLEKVFDNKTEYGYGLAATYFILPKLQTKLSYEKAFRLPESAEMFGDGLIQQRNPDLKPESSNNVNFGLMFEQIIQKHHTFFAETNLIYRNTKDFIQKDLAIATAVTGFKNLGRVLTKGIEGNVKYQWKNRLQISANLTYQDIIDDMQYEQTSSGYTGGSVAENINYGQRLPNIPYFFGYGEVGLRWQNVAFKRSELLLDYSCHYTQEYFLAFPGLGARSSKKMIPEQISHDISLGYTLDNGQYGVSLECTNLTNERLYDNYRLQKPTRAFNLKLRYFLK